MKAVRGWRRNTSRDEKVGKGVTGTFGMLQGQRPQPCPKKERGKKVAEIRAKELRCHELLLLGELGHDEEPPIGIEADVGRGNWKRNKSERDESRLTVKKAPV